MQDSHHDRHEGSIRNHSIIRIPKSSRATHFVILQMTRSVGKIDAVNERVIGGFLCRLID